MFEALFFKAPGSGMIPLHLPDLSDPCGEQCWGWEEWNTGELVPGFASCVRYLCMIQVDYYFVCPNGNDCLNLNNHFNWLSLSVCPRWNYLFQMITTWFALKVVIILNKHGLNITVTIMYLKRKKMRYLAIITTKKRCYWNYCSKDLVLLEENKVIL